MPFISSVGDGCFFSKWLKSSVAVYESWLVVAQPEKTPIQMAARKLVNNVRIFFIAHNIGRRQLEDTGATDPNDAVGKPSAPLIKHAWENKYASQR